jgi:hypothetical protein
MDSQENPLVLLATITLPEPLQGLLEHHRPAKLVLITGESFKPALEQALRQTAGVAASATIVTVDGKSNKPSPVYSDASACFDAAYEAAHQAREDAKRSYGRVVCDFSEGTFLLRLGLLRAAEELGLPGVYRAGGDEAPLEVPREDIDLQREQPFLFQQTLNEVEELVNANRFDAAHFVVEKSLHCEACSINSDELAFFGFLHTFVDALISWDRFDYRGAAQGLKPMFEQLASLPANPHTTALADASGKLLKWLEQVGSGVSSEFLAYDFLASAVRSAERGAYSDALMRLYRALEAHAQYEACRYFNVSSTENFPTELIPNRTLFFSGHPLFKHGLKMDLGMEATYAILRAAGSDVGERFGQYYARPPTEGMSLREMQSMRNNSPLAHGSSVISGEDFRKALKLMNSFLEVGKREAWDIAPVVRIKLS